MREGLAQVAFLIQHSYRPKKSGENICFAVPYRSLLARLVYPLYLSFSDSHSPDMLVKRIILLFIPCHMKAHSGWAGKLFEIVNEQLWHLIHLALTIRELLVNKGLNIASYRNPFDLSGAEG
jgi:hypothetical protein